MTGSSSSSSSRSRGSGAEKRPRFVSALLAYSALIAVCALCYSNSLWGEFVHDDVWAIVNNPDVRPGSSLRSIFTNDFWGKRMADNTSHKSYRPLCVLTFKRHVFMFLNEQELDVSFRVGYEGRTYMVYASTDGQEIEEEDGQEIEEEDGREIEEEDGREIEEEDGREIEEEDGREIEEEDGREIEEEDGREIEEEDGREIEEEDGREIEEEDGREIEEEDGREIEEEDGREIEEEGGGVQQSTEGDGRLNIEESTITDEVAGEMEGNEHFLKKNWEGLLEKVSARLSKLKWLLPHLSYRGRVLVVNNLAASTLWHKTNVMEPPEELVSSIQRSIVDFFWNGQHWLRAVVLYLPVQEGGQGLVDVRSRIRAFRIQAAQRLLYHKDVVWEKTAGTILRRVGGFRLDKHLFLMELKELRLSELTPYYKSMLHTWRTVMRTERDMDNLEQWTPEEPLFFNPCIEEGWIPTEELKAVTGLRSSRLAAKLQEELCNTLPSSYRTYIGQRHGTTQDRKSDEEMNIVLGGMTPFYFHVVNVCLHCAVTALLMHTCKHYVFKDTRLAFLTALLFAVHPIHTEAVSGIVGRADVLACMLFLLAFLSYIRSVSACSVSDCSPSTALRALWHSVCSWAPAPCWSKRRASPCSECACCTTAWRSAASLSSRRHLSRSRLKELIRISRPFIKRTCVVSVYVLFILCARLWLMGGSMPLFSEQDNPASFSPLLLTRQARTHLLKSSSSVSVFLTYCYLLAFNAWLLLAPIVLCYDWQVGSIPLVESLWDSRNMAAVMLALGMLALCLHCVTSLQNSTSVQAVIWCSSSSQISESLGVAFEEGPDDLHHCYDSKHLRDQIRHNTKAVIIITITVVIVIVFMTMTHCYLLTKMEDREVLVGILFLVFPFIPATNLFFRVGFVVAERVLYMPRPGLTTTAIGAVDLQGAGGNWATVGRRSRGGRRVHRQREKRKGKSVGLRIGTLNVGTMTGKGRELADMMERRKVDILCVQETRWKGSKARSIGAGFKLFYYGVDSKRNGVGVVLKEEFVRNVLEVKRVSDRVMGLKLEIEGVMLNVVSGYAPQVGCELEEKERFWSELDEVMESIPTGERVVIGADFNEHVGEGNAGDEEVMGKFGVKERNLEGQMVVDFAKRMDMGVVNTYFQKREEHRVTYKSGDLEKAYDRVPREELWYCMRKSGVAEKYREWCRTCMRGAGQWWGCAVGQTEEFNVEVGLHRGSALSPFLFAIVMDQLSEEVRQESPWTMMFAEGIVICSESREQVEENLERWRFALERRGMKVSRSKTEYMCVNEREGSGTVSMGYCILVVGWAEPACAVLSRWGAAALTVSMLLLLLLFSWRTVPAERDLALPRSPLQVGVCVDGSGIQTLPHNAKVHYNYANFLKDKGQNQAAIHHYKKALRLYPRHASAMNNLGTLTHDTKEAELYYRKALDINPQHNRALFNLGNLLKETIRFGPQFADAYSSLASLYADQKRFAEANEIYTKGIENCPDSSDLHNNYGVFLVDTGDGERAAIHYQHAVQLKRSHYVAMVNLARLLRSSNDSKEAEFWYKRALQVVRKVDILTPLGALYYNTGRYEEALQVYREAASLQPDNQDIWLALAQVLAMAGRAKEAEKMTLSIISKSIGCIECYRLLSAIYSKQGNHTEALDALDRALQQEPMDTAVKAELHFSIGNQLREMNELDRAFESYKLAVALKPDQSQAWMNMGGIQHIKGDYVAARTYYQRALLLSPGSKLLKENLAKLDRLEKKLQGG
ncbi:hypothetical protein QTP70_018967 [Hemibagrus guttatus]|uniref:dolichyl-phosphate-mannose--protein mannosyltransferase n=1 Tax=Hemibagrus guttatus TaxID=175788 RepID=A0AAE0URZ1_9TELE|nr:hypothetical protein QTP70_018967 [Hemibagrus guttatus]